MVNTDAFIKRLEIILDYYSLNASAFADKIGVQRSSLSHLLSGRNKPSLDFILKIVDVFPDIDLYWILKGIGSFPKNPDTILSQENKQQDLIKPIVPTPTMESLPIQNLFTGQKNEIDNTKAFLKKEETQNNANESISGEVVKIVFFYKNGTFKEFTPN